MQKFAQFWKLSENKNKSLAIYIELNIFQRINPNYMGFVIAVII